jgi:putative ABC transport system permease protein
MDTLRQDLVYAIRRLWQSPVFSLVAIATLALGIGANSAIFSVIDAVLLRPLPFAEPERLVQLAQTWKGRSTGIYSPQNFLDVAAQAPSFSSLAAIDSDDLTMTGRGDPVRLQGARVSSSFFDLLGVRPVQGRAFTDGENEPGRTKVVVLSHGVWTQRFGADAGVIGQTVQLNREPYAVIGVAPAGFAYPEGAEVWAPLEYDEVFRTKSRGAWFLRVIGRLKPRVPVERARQEVATIADRLAKQYPDADEGVGGTAVSLQQATVGDVRRPLLVLLGAVGFVLLIACVNVANLLLARVAARDAEFAVRTALGAGRRRLFRQLLTESVLLGLLGGATGLFLAWVSLDALLALQPQGVPRLAEVRVDRGVVLFASVLSLVTGLVFGAFPALQMIRRPTAQVLREGGRGLLGSGGARLRGGLVVGQMALAMMLLAGAGLLIRSFSRLSHVDPGFRTEDALSFRISLPQTAYDTDPRRAAFFGELMTRLRALPGVRSVGGVSGLPLGGSSFQLSFEVAGQPPLSAAQQPSMEVRVATPDYFKTMGIPIRKGRGFEAGDIQGSSQVVLLSESAVRRFFPDEDPLGKRITIGWRHEPPAGGEVVGIVGDIKEQGLARASAPEIYLPSDQLPFSSMDVVLRTAVSPLSLAPTIQAAVHRLDPELPVSRVRTLEDVVARSISEPRFYMLLLGAFAAMALFLAALGIFGVMSYAVVQRSREIGIRVALGALPGDVLRSILREALLLSESGVALGLIGALALSQVLTRLLFDLSPTDPGTLVVMAVLLSAVALLASYLPARRATRVDPLVALRTE